MKKQIGTPLSGDLVSLQHVLERLETDPALAPSRRRDYRSAIVTYAKLTERPAAAIPLDLATIRNTLDSVVPAAAQVSRKRWHNLRSDLAGAIKASGLRPMLSTAQVPLDDAWRDLLDRAPDQRCRWGLTRFARWASLRGVAPGDVEGSVLERFIAEIETTTLVRKIGDQRAMVVQLWNTLAAAAPELGLVPLAVVSRRLPPRRIAWDRLPANFREDLKAHLAWCAVPDVLDDDARARRLAPLTLAQRESHVQSAVTAAVAAGITVDQLTSLKSLVEPDIVHALLRHRFEQDGRRLRAQTHGIAGTLIAIAREWVKAPAAEIDRLKTLRGRLGPLPSGLTEKNQAFLRKMNDPRLLSDLVNLPDRLWRRAVRDFATRPQRAFLDLQTSLAIDILLHVPLRMENLTSLSFARHLSWPQGRGKAAHLLIRAEEMKNSLQIEFDIPAALADRLVKVRDEFASSLMGHRPEAVFVFGDGRPRTQQALTIAIERAVLRHVGIDITPHQFRHLCAKIILDANPGAIELVRQMLGHKNLKTTTNYYAGIDTRRAGRAHIDLILKLREASTRPQRRRTRRNRRDKE